MNRISHKFVAIAATLVSGLAVLNPNLANAAIITKYTFAVEGFSGGGTLSGMFDSIDLNNDGLLVADNLNNGIVDEISNFIAEFTGDSLIPDLTFKQEEIFYQTSWRFLPDGRLSLVGFDMETSEGFLGADLDSPVAGLAVGTFDNQISFVAPGEVIAKPVIVPESVPEPSSTLGLSILSLGFILKKKLVHKA